MSLSDEVAEMFAELDGYGRYESEIEQWSFWRAEKHERTAADRLDRRNYMRRYLSVGDRRKRWNEYVAKWRAERKARLQLPRRNEAQHGTYAKYTGGCRCADCRIASSKYRRELRARKRLEERRAA